MSEERWIAYSYAFLRVVPHVHLGAFTNVGVVVHARTAGFLGMRATFDPFALAACVPRMDHELLARYLQMCADVCSGEPGAGPVALIPASERFHWLTAPRSDVLQPSPVHVGLCLDPGTELETLFRSCVHDPRSDSA